jgi:hypothetical protein
MRGTFPMWEGPVDVFDGAVAQWSEQRTHNPSAVGSIPTRPTETQATSDAATGAFTVPARTVAVFVSV